MQKCMRFSFFSSGRHKTRAIFINHDIELFRQFESAILINLLINIGKVYNHKGRPISHSSYLFVRCNVFSYAKQKIFYVNAFHGLNISVPHWFATEKEE